MFSYNSRVKIFSVDLKCRKFFKSEVFPFFKLESSLLKYKRNIRLESSFSRNTRKFRFPKYKKVLSVEAGKCVR